MASTYRDQSTGLQNGSESDSSGSLGRALGSSVSGGRATAYTGNSDPAKTNTGNTYLDSVNNAMNSDALKFDAAKYDSVSTAQNYLNNVIANKPGSYQSKYTGQLSNLYDQLMNRGPFTYDMNGDALYQQYAQRYAQQGKQGMRDMIGQANANTGGYGSSYAQTAGQSAYNSYMAQLQQAIPELQSSAQTRYDNETNQITNRYNLVNTADQSDYNRFRDNVGDWQNERTYAANRADTEYDRAYTQWSDSVNAGMTAEGNQRQIEQNDKSSAQSMVTTMINAGVKPSSELLKQAGYSEKDAYALVKKKKG